MVKRHVPAHIRNLADKYYLEQCDRLGLPRPKPPKAGRGIDTLVETGVWIHPDMRKRIGKDRKEGLSLEALFAQSALVSLEGKP